MFSRRSQNDPGRSAWASSPSRADAAPAADVPRLLAGGVEVQVGVVGVGRHRVLREHEPLRAHVADVAGRVGEPALAALVDRQVGEVADRRRALGLGRRDVERAERGVRLERGRAVAGRPARAEPELARARQPGDVRARALGDHQHGQPLVARDQRVGVPVRRVPEHVVDADRVRADIARARRLPAQPAAGEDQEHLVLVGVAVWRGRALPRIDRGDRDAEPPRTGRCAEPPPRRGQLAGLPAVDRDVVEVEREAVGHPGRMPHPGSLGPR